MGGASADTTKSRSFAARHATDPRPRRKTGRNPVAFVSFAENWRKTNPSMK
jgi:hypothetical protein